MARQLGHRIGMGQQGAGEAGVAVVVGGVGAGRDGAQVCERALVLGEHV